MKDDRMPIEGFKDYLVTRDGRVLSLKYGKEKVLKNQPKGTGYHHVVLSENGRTTIVTVHRIVAMAFVENKENKPCVNHKDLDKGNNNATNLEWVTFAENNDHARDNGLAMGKMRKPVVMISNSGYMRTYKSMNEAARRTGVKESHISETCAGRYEMAKGLHFLYY